MTNNGTQLKGEVSCDTVPDDYKGIGDGCDCPANGDTECDRDCAVGNAATEWCGCEFCYSVDGTPPSEDDEESASGGQDMCSDCGTLSVKLPDNMAPQEPAIVAQGTLSIGQGCEVRRRNGGHAPVVNMGDQQTEIGPDTSVGDVWTECPAKLKDGAQIRGTLYAGDAIEQHPDCTILDGTENVERLPNPVVHEWTPELPNTSDETKTSGDLAPGGYAGIDVEAGDTVKLSGGIYHIGVLDIADGGTLVVDDTDGPVIVYVDSGVTFDGTIQNEAGEFDPDTQILIVVLGDSDVRFGGPFTGAVHAPGAPITLGHPGEPGYWGSFFGRDVRIGDGVVVTHNPFPWSYVLPPSAEQGWGPSSVHLEASLNHTDGENTPGEVRLDPPRWFTVPSFIQVRTGNAGNGTVVLNFDGPDRELTTCVYQGGASSTNPTTHLERMLGMRYELVSCNDGTPPDIPVEADRCRLKFRAGMILTPRASPTSCWIRMMGVRSDPPLRLARLRWLS